MLLLRKCNLLSMGDINYVYRDILIDINGKIIKIAEDIPPQQYPDIRVIKVAGRYVTPGLIDAHCHIGLSEDIIKEGQDINESSHPITPELRAIDGINCLDPAFKNALHAGVTTVQTGPGSANAIAGTFAILKTYGKTLGEMVLKDESAMKMALGENPKLIYGNKGQAPVTRMATTALIRNELQKAKEYYQQYETALMDERFKKPEYNQKLHSLMRVFKGMPVKIHAHRLDDIETAIRIMNEFDLNGTIDHCTEGYMAPELLKEHRISCIIGPTMTNRSKPELANKSFESGRILKENGIEFAIMTDHPVIELENMLLQLGRFVRAGLSELDALRAVTLDAARICGLEERLGSIEVGKDADIVIWTHHPLHYLATPKMVIINGKVVFREKISKYS